MSEPFEAQLASTGTLELVPNGSAYMLKQEIEKLKAEIAQAEEALTFIQSPQRYEPKPEENSLLHDLRGLIAAEQSEADRVVRLEQAKSLLQSKRDRLAAKQAKFYEHVQAATDARQNLEANAAKLQEMVDNFRQEFNQVLLEMRATADESAASLAELEYNGLKIAFDPNRPHEVAGRLPSVLIGESAITIQNHWSHPRGVHPGRLVNGAFPLGEFWQLLAEPEAKVEISA